jgi:hypothetical protein
VLVRSIVRICSVAAVVVGPVALAFFSGGYFDEPRAWAGLGAWCLVLVAVVVSRRPWPRTPRASLALLSLALFAIWTLISFTWAPLAGSAYHAGQIAFLYLGGMIAAVALLRGREARVLEPAVAAGALVVIGYALAERVLPGLLHYQHSVSAEGRLEQPLTYWNATGALAALGLVVCARLAGDVRRAATVRAGFAAGAAPLGVGLYLSFSRGALFACFVGLLTLLVLHPARPAWRGIAVSVTGAVLTAAVSAPLSGVTSLSGSEHRRELEGAILLVALIAVASAAAGATLVIDRRERTGKLDTGPVRLPRRAGAVTGTVIVMSFALFLAVGAKESSVAAPGAGASRLATLQSNRYSYWRVAWRAFKAEPLHGVGAGGWAVYWLRYRPFDAGAQDAHSLYIQTAAELGIVGLALLATFLASLAGAARSAWVADPVRVAGPIAGFLVWIFHAAVDWDWQMPALTLPALLLAAGVLASYDELAGARAPATGASAANGEVAAVPVGR